MSETTTSLSKLFLGLQSLESSAFPKKCPKCGTVFISLLDMICLTDKSLQSSGLVESIGESSQPIVGLFRNCACGATLFVFCRDRRDTSADGLRRRETFGQLLQQYQDSGLDYELVRRELIKVVNGEGSELLQDFSNPDVPEEKRNRARSLLTKH